MKWFVVALALTACSKSTPPASSEGATDEAASADAPMAEDPAGEPMAEEPPAGEPMAEDPGAAAASGACSTEVMVTCDEGQKDGCMVTAEDGTPLTLVHVCTPDTAPGPPCENEVMRECGEGLVDACTTSPAQAASHICVKAP